jgi:hypothetical protein
MAFNASFVTADAKAITPGTTALTLFGFYVGGTGDVNVITSRGTTVLFKAVPAGVSIPLCISQVRSTNTTATSIVGYGPQ